MHFILICLCRANTIHVVDLDVAYLYGVGASLHHGLQDLLYPLGVPHTN